MRDSVWKFYTRKSFQISNTQSRLHVATSHKIPLKASTIEQAWCKLALVHRPCTHGRDGFMTMSIPCPSSFGAVCFSVSSIFLYAPCRRRCSSRTRMTRLPASPRGIPSKSNANLCESLALLFSRSLLPRSIHKAGTTPKCQLSWIV